MEIALIAPVPLLDTTEWQKYHMMLPAVVGNWEYDEFYKRLGRKEGCYVILDNGAWEGVSLSATELMNMAYRFHVQEVVVPDIINGQPEDTLDMINVFFKSAAVAGTFYGDWPQPKWAAVVHGSTIEEAKDFIDIVAKQFPQISVFALAKKLPQFCQNWNTRGGLASYIRSAYGDRFEIHLLGYNEHIPSELDIRARSIDMTTPYTCSLKGKGLGVLDEVQVPRPKDYFSLGPESFNMSDLRYNIELVVGRTDR
jgi:hypothetical protein